jgi:exodeoxyribonuclease VII large subunit
MGRISMTQFSLNFLPERKTWTVSEINAAIREYLETEFSDVWVDGEISNLRLAPSGHYYFTLKDAAAQLKCVLFKMSARYLKFRPDDGLAVLARGKITVYEVRGEYQMVVEHLEARGAGALQVAFEQLKKKLAAEGLFDATRKRPLPLLPRRIGIVTSPRGAVIADMVRILKRRFPGLHLRLYPVRVQGEEAAGDICEAIGYFSRIGWAQLVIVGRGGGSLEDLWPFNEEKVARAIAACAIPVISAVGHETDFTIADFVADLRAPTPSAAAELAVRLRAQFVEQVEGLEERLGRALQYRVMLAAQRIDDVEVRLRERIRRRLLGWERRLALVAARVRGQDPRVRLAAQRERWMRLAGALEPGMEMRLQKMTRRVEGLAGRLETATPRRLERLRGRVESLTAQLGQLSPLGVLERGYAIVQDERGGLVRRSKQTRPGERLRVRLATGRLGVDVREVE